MNIKSLLSHLERINSEHPDTGMRMDISEKEEGIDTIRVEIFEFPSIGVRYVIVPATHVYVLTRLAFDTWYRETIRGG